MARIVNGVHIAKHPNRILGEVEDLRGQQFGNLTVYEFDHKDKQGRAIWNCSCTCGHTRLVRANHLKSGVITSCGYSDHRARIATQQRVNNKSEKQQVGAHPGIVWMSDRNAYRVSISIGNRKMKYIGLAESLEYAQSMRTKAKEEFQTDHTITLSHAVRHQNGIIGIDPTGKKHYYHSVSEAQNRLGTHANLYRHLKDGSSFTRKRSKLYGWTFKYQ